MFETFRSANPNLRFSYDSGTQMQRGVPTCTPLIRASDAGNLGIVRLLLRYGAEVNARDGYNNTALLKATTHANLDIVQELLGQGANPNLEGLMFDVDAKEDNFT